MTEAQFQLGWRGYVQLAQRSGQYKTINVSDVRQGELSKIDRLSGNVEFDWCEDDAERDHLPVIGYVAMFELTTGFTKVIYWSRQKMQNHAEKYSKAYAYDLRSNKKLSPWSTDFESMAYKTMIKQIISKWGPMSVDMQRAVEADQGVIKEDGSVDYIDGVAVDAANERASDDKKNAIIAANKGEGDAGDSTAS